MPGINLEYRGTLEGEEYSSSALAERMNRGQRASTPSNPSSRVYAATIPRSPIKTSHHGRCSQDPGLTLKRVIGTTCQSVTCFDCLPSSRAFAYTAGAAAVVATIADDGTISQRFYRANPVQSSPTLRAFFPGVPTKDSPDARHKPALQAREFGTSHSPRPALDWNDSPTSKQGSVKERVKAATTLSFSHNGKYIAVGETGYKPRVLIFSLDDKAPQDVPVAVIPEHTFGVQAVAFSPDSKYLASLGSVNDGFLYIWSIDERTGAATLVASNKCSNVIKQMVWIGQCLITVGLRFVKVWRPIEPSSPCNGAPDQRSLRGHRPLAGRNALLGDLLDATFTCVVPLSEDKAIVCSDGGDVCILDDAEKNQRLTRVANVDFSIAAACLDSKSHLFVTGLDGSMKTLDAAVLQTTILPSTTPPGSSTPVKSTPLQTTHFLAIGAVSDIVVTVDNNHGIQLRRAPDGEPGEVIYAIPAHSDAVLGVRALQMPNKSNATFLTWSAGGTVIYWSSKCQMTATLKVPMNQSVDLYNISNELKSVTSLSSEARTISGDRYGVLRISDTTSGTVTSSLRAHSGEITDIAVFEDDKNTLIASSSRDRTIQLFSLTPKGLDLVQTLDEHAGSVTCLHFAKGGSQLISCSADRTVVVREAVHRDDGAPALFVIARTIILKNSPTSMRLAVYKDAIIVSATDRCIQVINTRTGRVLSSFKASDAEGGDAVIMSSLAHLPSSTGPPIIAGVSSSDKSVRLYSEEGVLLARDWGHTEGVTDIAIIHSRNEQDTAKLITVAADGTIFVWKTEPGRPDSSGSDHGLQVPSAGVVVTAPSQQPLRKVISQSELARFHRQQSADLAENEPPSPTAAAAMRLPTTLRHKSSRLGAKSTLRLDPSPLANGRSNHNGKGRQRSPSPSPPNSLAPSSPSRTRHPIHVSVRSSRGNSVSTVDERRGSTSTGARPESREFGSVGASTEQLCRTLKAYRQRLEKSGGDVPPFSLAELENELQTTLKHVTKALAKYRPDQDEEQSRCASSSQEASFVSAESHQVDERDAGAGAVKRGGEGEVRTEVVDQVIDE